MDNDGFVFELGDSPILATAVHAGSSLRAEVASLMGLPVGDRLREEDPYTDRFVAVTPNRIVPRRSRFEVDLNRPRSEAVYRTPGDAWGLQLWNDEPSEDIVAGSLAYYDQFYALLAEACDTLQREHGRFVVLDCHSYNHRRSGPDGPPEDPAASPEVNVGTGSMDRVRWGPLVDRFMTDLAAFDLGRRTLDVRENVKFRGRNVAAFVHERYPETGTALAIEFKKTFMDEWTGELDEGAIETLREALASTVPGLLDEITGLG